MKSVFNYNFIFQIKYAVSREFKYSADIVPLEFLPVHENVFLYVCMCFQMHKLLMICEINSEQTSHRESDELFAFILGLNFYRQCMQMMHSS